ncbi:MAG TPA: hypothetical protein VJQ26_05275 [Ktedonobacteraceae bacterium]|nr:hypothetical protein [Ktedonobacteraceae bacterium]
MRKETRFACSYPWRHANRRKAARPHRLIADREYDRALPSGALLVRRGIELIIPARGKNQRATHQDGRRWHRARRRWIVERTIGRLATSGA